MASKKTNKGSFINRRKFLQSTAVGGTLFAAGCASIGGSDEEPTAFRLTDIYDPVNLQYNWMNPTNDGTLIDRPGALMFDRFVLYTPPTDEFHPQASIIKDWTLDGSTLTATITNEHTWHDGEPVTVEDIVAHFTLAQYQYEAAGSEHPYIDAVESVDDTTVEFTLHEEFNETILIQYLFTLPEARLWTQASVFQEYIDQFEEASDQSEMEGILSELQRMEINEPIGNGPFQYSDADEQTTLLELFEDHPSADQINFTTVDWQSFSDGQAELQAIRGGDVDATTNISPQDESVMEQWPAGLDTPRYEVPNYGGRTLRIQHDHEILGISEVRQAFAHVISRENVATNTSPNIEVNEIMAEIPAESMDEWIGDSMDNFNRYETDVDRAAELMEEAGFSQEGGQWVDESGNPVTIEVKSAPFADSHVPVAQTAANNLQEFGIDATFYQLEQSQWGNDVANGNYHLITEEWGMGLPHPYYYLEEVFDGTLASSANIPAEYEVPPVGEPEGSTETVNAVDIVRSIPSQSDEEVQQSIQQLAWIANQELPTFPLTTGVDVPWMFQPDRFHFTTDDEGLLRTENPMIHGPRMGILQAREEESNE